jgi:phage tail sheath gpL-like
MAQAVIAIEGDGTAGVEQGIVAAEATTDITDLSLDIEWETPAIYLSEPKLANLVVIEAHTNSQTLTVAVVADGTANTLTTTVSTASKARVEIPIAITGTIFAVRLTATALTSRIEVAAIELNIPDSGVQNPEPG